MLDKDALQALPEDGDVSSHFTSMQYIPSDESMQNAKKKRSLKLKNVRVLLYLVWYIKNEEHKKKLMRKKMVKRILTSLWLLSAM